MYGYDELDIAILKELRENGKHTAREIAKKLGTHPNTMVHRIRRLEKNNVIIKYTIEIDYRRLGYDLQTVALLKIKKGKIGEVSQLKEVIEIPEMQALYAITGSYDILCILRTKDQNHLSEVLRKLQRIDVVTRSNTILVLYTYKHHYEFEPILEEIGKKTNHSLHTRPSQELRATRA